MKLAQIGTLGIRHKHSTTLTHPVKDHHIKQTFLKRCHSTSSLHSGWTPKMFEARNIMEFSVGSALALGQRFFIASDGDGTLIHSKAPIHKAVIQTHSEFELDANWDEDESLKKIHGPQDVVFQKMFSGTTVCPKVARTKFEQKLDTYYSQETTLMPNAAKFLEVVSILQKHGVLGFSIVSFMNHDPLNLATQKLGINPRFTRVVEGLKNEGQDKDTPEIFTQRVLPKMYNYGFGTPSKVLCIGDSRYTDRVMSENVPDEKGVYIAFSNSKDENGTLKEEKDYPWIPDWNTGSGMLVDAALRALKELGPERVGYTRYVQLRRDLSDSVGIDLSLYK